MINKQRYTSVILIVLILLIGFFLYDRYFKEIILNNSSRSVDIKELKGPKLIHLSKKESQEYIHSIEIEIRGKSNKSLPVLIGTDNDKFHQQILLKKGTIDFQYSSDWYTDDCYLMFQGEPDSDVELELEYRFIGHAK